MTSLLSLIGLIHTAASLFSMIVGAVIIFGTKGTARHVQLGRRYFYAMLITNLTALTIYRGGVFFFPHWLAIVTLIALVLGYWVVRTKAIPSWLSVHISCMVSSYYMLAGGAVNEAFLRIEFLQPSLDPANGFFGNPVIGMVHGVVMLMFIVLLVVFLRQRKIALPVNPSR